MRLASIPIQTLTLLCLFGPVLNALPTQRMTGTKPHYLDVAKRADMALPLEQATPSHSAFVGALHQEPLGGDAEASQVDNLKHNKCGKKTATNEADLAMTLSVPVLID